MNYVVVVVYTIGARVLALGYRDDLWNKWICCVNSVGHLINKKAECANHIVPIICKASQW